MINYHQASLRSLSVHSVPGAQHEAEFLITKEPVILEDEMLQDVFLRFFFGAFKEPEFYSFDHFEGDSNRMYSLAAQIFDDPSMCHYVSKEIARHLQSQSTHPNIRKGELIVAHIRDVLIEDELVSALVVLKSESKESFIDVHRNNDAIEFRLKKGIYPKKMDKACIIFNTKRGEGFKLCVADKINSREEALYWKQLFLDVKKELNDYHNTKVYIQATRSFIDERLKPMYELEKQDEAQLMSNSKHYFDSNKQFDEESYLDSLFGKQADFKEEFKLFQSERNWESDDNFRVSQAAVKKQNKVFRSVIKLDKNFHIYVHGNRNMIERGTDANGRKFYKLYFDHEE